MVSENSARGPPPHNPTPPKKEDRRPRSFNIQAFFLRNFNHICDYRQTLDHSNETELRRTQEEQTETSESIYFHV